ncbi:MAG TPA: hypothetical protein RMH99_17510 [Sandaracinaceae bacterium LLY-WYZ-13_1]|nr:hypothetical protein [Sandaracinaceae bacterium LLY-WYZ-13_1]
MLGAAALLLACDPGPSLLLVDVRTDLVAGVEFDTVRVEVLSGAASGRFAEAPADAEADWVAGSRVAELMDLPAGELAVRVALLRDGAVVLDRPVRVDLEGALAVTVVMTRDCRGVECPRADADPTALACAGGRCVDDRCAEESPDRCGDPECTVDADCEPAPAECATVRCVSGLCLRAGDDAACDEGWYCDPDVGCRERPDALCDPFPGRSLELMLSGDTTCVRAEDEPLRCWGDSGIVLANPDGSPFDDVTPVLTDRRWRDVAIGDEHLCGVDDAGAFVCLGSNWAGQLGNGVAGDATSEPTEPLGGLSPRAVGAGSATSCAIDEADERLHCWGHHDAGQTGVGGPIVEEVTEPTPTDGDHAWRSVAPGHRHGCGIRDDGSLWCWGTNSSEQLGQPLGTTFGTFGEVSPSPIVLDDAREWSAVAVGSEFGVALTADGELWTVGANFVGQLGRLDPDESGGEHEMGRVDGSWTAIAAGWRHACAIRDGGELYCWGDDTWDQLGPGVAGDYAASPVRVLPERTWVDVGAGSGHTCALDDTGRVWCWGANDERQLARGAGPASGVPRTVCP